MVIRSIFLALIILVFLILSPVSPSAAFQETPEPPTTSEEVTADSMIYLPMAWAGVSSAPPPPPPPSGPTVINHNSVALFERIPDRYLQTARSYGVLFSDRSVGQNFHESLDCLTANSFGTSPAYCRHHWSSGFSAYRVYTQDDYNAGRVPAVIRFTPNPTRYNRNNWDFEARSGSWSELTQDFIQVTAPAHMNKQVLSYQFSYLNIMPGSDIMRFWSNNPTLYDIYDLEAFWRAHPTKTFVLWTTSLAREMGTQEAQDFNTRMRQYAIDHNMWLFDFAAIESYTHSSQPCYDNRDGVPYTNPMTGEGENLPNDGRSLPAICQDYTTEHDGGHLGSVSGARIRAAKAFWVLMARIAGWDGTSQ